jgi:predicted RNase H-like HicB family nuclease
MTLTLERSWAGGSPPEKLPLFFKAEGRTVSVLTLYSTMATKPDVGGGPDQLTFVRYETPTTILIQFADGLTAKVNLEVLGLDLARLRVFTAKVFPGGTAIEIDDVDGEPVLIDSAAARAQVDPQYAAELDRVVTAVRDPHGQGSRVVVIDSVAPEPYRLASRVQAVVRPEEDGFVASFPDAGIHASGETQQEAVANLKDMMVLVYRCLSEEPAERLGSGPARQLSVLRNYLIPETGHV